MIDAFHFVTHLRPLVFSKCTFDEMFLLQGVAITTEDPSSLELSGESELGVSKFAAWTISFLRSQHASSPVRFRVYVTPLPVGVIIKLRWEPAGIPDAPRAWSDSCPAYVYGSAGGRRPRGVYARRTPRRASQQTRTRVPSRPEAGR